MNDPRHRGPTRPPNGNPFFRDPRPNLEPEPNFDEEPTYRPPQTQRAPGGPPGRRPPREPVEPGTSRGRRPPRGPEDFDAGFEQRPPRRSRPPDLNPEMPPPRRPRTPPAERSGWEYGEPEMREGRPDPRAGPDWAQGRSPRRRRRPQGMAPAQKKFAAPRQRIDWRYRYGALLGIMLFAAIGGICLGFSGLGSSRGANIGLIVASVPALLLGMGCAFVFVYF